MWARPGLDRVGDVDQGKKGNGYPTVPDAKGNPSKRNAIEGKVGKAIHWVYRNPNNPEAYDMGAVDTKRPRRQLVGLGPLDSPTLGPP